MEKSNNIERSEVWEQIYNLVKQIPREECEGDAPDAPSVTTSIEELFLKLLPIQNVVGSEITGDFYLQTKIVTRTLNDCRVLLKEIEKRGFSPDNMIQDNNEVYWTFAEFNNGLVAQGANE